MNERASRICRLFTAFFILFSLATRPFMPGDPSSVSWNLFFVLLYSIAGVFSLVEVALLKRYSFPRTKLILPITLWVFVIIASSVFAYNHRQAIIQAVMWLGDIVFFLTVICLIMDQEKRRFVLAALLASVAIESCYGLYQYYIGLPAARLEVAKNPGLIEEMGINGKAKDAFMIRLSSNRIFGTFILANSLGGYLILLFPVVIGLFITSCIKKHFYTAILSAGVAFFIIYTLLLSDSLGSILALGGALTLWFYLRFRYIFRKKSTLVLVTCVLLGLIFFDTACKDSWLYKKITSHIGERGESFAIRIAFWQASLKIIPDHPILGVGPDNFRYHYLHYKLPWAEECKMAHNSYLQVAVEMGILGGVAFLFLIFRGIGTLGFTQEPKSTICSPPASSSALYWGVIVGSCAFLFLFISERPLDDSGKYSTILYIISIMIWAGVFSAPWVLHGGVLTGIRIGLTAFLLHNLVDFDLYTQGITQTVWALLALAITDPANTENYDTKGHFQWIFAVSGLAIIYLLGTWLVPSSFQVENIKETIPATLCRAKEKMAPNLYRNYVELLDTAMQLDPWDDSLLIEKGTFLCQVGYAMAKNKKPFEEYFKIGMACLRHATDINPYYGVNYFQLASGYELEANSYRLNEDKRMERETWILARDAIKKAIRFTPTSSRVWFLAGKIEENLGNLEKAKEHYYLAFNLSHTPHIQGGNISPYEENILYEKLLHLIDQRK